MTEREVGRAWSPQDGFVLRLIAVSVVLVASYWNSLFTLPWIWVAPEYSYGYIIPLLALLLLWYRGGADSTFELGPVEKTAAALAGVGSLLLLSTGVFNLSVSTMSVIGLIGTMLALAGGLIFVRPTWPPQETPTPDWMGAGLLAVGCGIRMWGAWHMSATLEFYSFIFSMAGGIMLVGGLPALKWGWPAALVLFLMFPFPEVLRAGLVEPLKRMAIQSSTYCLQTLGLAAFSEGNVIHIGQTKLSVIEACSGLRMFTTLSAMSFAIAFLFADRPIWERCVVALSAAPISVITNIARITVTGILFKMASSDVHFLGMTFTKEFADHVFHDWAGYFMMPLAFVLLYLEMQILPRIFLEQEQDPGVPSPIGPGGTLPRQPVSAGR